MERNALRPRRLAWALPLLSFCAVALASSAAATREEATRAAEIDPTVRTQLARDADGRVAAVITAWNRAGLARIERLGVTGTKLTRLPMLLTKTLTRAQLKRLSRSPDVRSVYANTPYELLMEDTTWITRARYAWSTASGGLEGLSVTGSGVDVAVIDTGADGGHEDMENLVEFCESQQAVSGDHTTVLCSPFNPGSGNAGPAGPTNTARGDATDDNGHGTHVSGTIAGSGSASGGRDHAHSTIGLSPDARLHVYSANIGASLLAHEILASYDDMTNKKLLGLSNVVAVNNSWGGGDGADYGPNDPVHVAIKAAYDAGILSVFAAGNSGAEHNTLSRQCVSPWVVCVAASTKPDAVVMFSSRGRPSEPADTNRDGVVGGTGDIAPGNHDRALGQALELGLYRPALAAPGVNINSMRANAAACRESGGTGTPSSAATRLCYEPLNGTSMATPHVVGAVPLIVQAYRQSHRGRTPTPTVVTDVLERSANVHKLPAYESEEEGAGRLDVYTAVRFARSYPRGLDEPVLGHPTPSGLTASTVTSKGCTGTLSWTARSVENPLLDPVGQPPVATSRFGQHLFEVAPRTERLRITASWPRHPSANLYLRLWRPGVDPDAETEPAGPARVFADQEAVGLVFVGSSRWLDIRSPEEGTWTLRVYHRAGGEPLACDADSSERPKQTEGFNYNLRIDRPTVSASPTVSISAPAEGATLTDRWVTVSGGATYPAPWDGVTNWEVANSGNPVVRPEPDDRLVLHFQGNVEEGCTGDGATDVIACGGPFLRPDATLSAANAASWRVANPLLNGGADRTIHDPNWTWYLSEPTTVGGDMTVEWWGSCGACDSDLGLGADWRIRLWADGTRVFERRVSAPLSDPNTAEKLSVTVTVPVVTASQRFVVHVDPVFVDVQNNSVIYYDSANACPTAAGGEACDSFARMPVLAAGSQPGPADPANVRVTDVHSGLRVAWDAAPGAARYEVYRTTSPAEVGRRVQRTTATSFTDSVPLLRTHYYRVVALDAAGTRGRASEVAYGQRTAYDRQVRVKVDRVYGPQSWEYASLGSAAATSWTFAWDTLELAGGPHSLFARSFTQGVGSTKARRDVRLAR